MQRSYTGFMPADDGLFYGTTKNIRISMLAPEQRRDDTHLSLLFVGLLEMHVPDFLRRPRTSRTRQKRSEAHAAVVAIRELSVVYAYHLTRAHLGCSVVVNCEGALHGPRLRGNTRGCLTETLAFNRISDCRSDSVVEPTEGIYVQGWADAGTRVT